MPGKLAFGIQSACGGRFSTVGGGIGCSSGTPEQDQDMACAQAGVDRFQKKLKDSKGADGNRQRRRN